MSMYKLALYSVALAACAATWSALALGSKHLALLAVGVLIVFLLVAFSKKEL